MKKLLFIITLIIFMIIDGYFMLKTFYYIDISEGWYWIYHLILAFLFFLLWELPVRYHRLVLWFYRPVHSAML